MSLLLIGMHQIFAQPTNVGFELWTNNEPDGWWVLDRLLPVPGPRFVSQSTDARSGNYAVKIEVLNVGGAGFLGMMTLNDPSMDESESGIPYTQRPVDFSFWAKYNLLSTDSFIVVVELTKWNAGTRVRVGEGTFVRTGTQNNYQKYTVPITYYSNDTPDSLQMFFVVGGILGSAPTFTPGSYALIDDVDILGATGGGSSGAPAAPTNLTVTLFKTAYTGIRLTWQDNSNNETSFVIERATDSSGPFNSIGNVGANVSTFDDVNVTNGVTYYYRVYAQNANGNSAFSNTANITASGISGLDRVTSEDIQIYPNPSSGRYIVNIPTDWQGSRATIYDITGRVLISERVERAAVFDLSEVGRGCYFIRIEDGERIMQQKLILE